MAVSRLRGRWMHVSSVARDVGAGVLSGVFGGLLAEVVLVFLLIVTSGEGPMYPFQLVASFLVGDLAFGPWGVSLGLLGLGMLGIVAIVWGVVFGLCANLLDVRRGPALLALALGVGVVAQVIDLYVIAPIWLETSWGWDRWHEAVPDAVGWTVHLIYGLGLCVFPRLYRSLWGIRPRNWYAKRRYDPIDPLGA